MEQLKQYDDFLVLPELKELIRPLSIKEHQTLEESILKDGILDSLKLGTIPITYCKYCAEDHDQWDILEPGAGGFLMKCKKCDHSSVQDYYLIDGHNRLAIAEKHGISYDTDCMEFESMDHIKLWITSNQLGRRNLTETEVIFYEGEEYNYKKVTDKFKGNQHTVEVNANLAYTRTADELADKHGKGSRTIVRQGEIAKGIKKLSDDLKQKVLSEEVKPRKQDLEIIAKADEAFIAHTPEEIIKEANRIKKEKKAEKDAKRAKILEEKAKEAAQLELAIDFFNGDFEEVLDYIPDGSIDCIITDPPYPYDYIECWTKLSRFAAMKLKPGGFCIAYSGQLHLPEVYRRMSEHLHYYWTFNLIHTGSRQLINPRNVFCGWKPLLVYQNGLKKMDVPCDDFIIGTGMEKDTHRWQQSLNELDYIIEKFTLPGDLICEPFAGGGTTIIAALKNKRRIVAAEIDSVSFNNSKSRISEWEKSIATTTTQI